MDDGAGQSQPLLKTARQVGRPPPGPAFQVEEAEQAGPPGPEPLRRKSVDASEKIDVLGCGQVAVQGELLAHVADPPLDALRVGGDVDPGDDGPPAVGREKSAEHLDRGCFARPVGSDESEDFPPADRKVDRLDRPEAAEPLLESADFHGWSGGHAVVPLFRRSKWMKTSSSDGRTIRKAEIRACFSTAARSAPGSAPAARAARILSP